MFLLKELTSEGVYTEFYEETMEKSLETKALLEKEYESFDEEVYYQETSNTNQAWLNGFIEKDLRDSLLEEIKKRHNFKEKFVIGSYYVKIIELKKYKGS